MKPLNDTRLRLLGPVGLFLFVGLFFRLDWYLKLPFKTTLFNDAIALTAGLVCWQIARYVVLQIQYRYPGLVNTRRRLLYLLAALPVLVFFAWLMRHWVRYLIDGKFLYFTSAVELSRTLGIQVFYHIIYFSVYEGWYILRQWQRETVESSDLEKMSLQSQLTSLQSQVNPHFLFNSLNSLSALIRENPDSADQFLDELTSVFRYLLQAGDQHLIPLRDELSFIRSYFHLLQTRYQTGLLLKLAIDEPLQTMFIPPLTLQMLVENAVRYNVILPEQPLHICISTTPDGWLRVENTLQRKPLRVDTTGARLTNLATKYELLGQETVLIEERRGWFVVTVPLLNEESSINSPKLLFNK
ncbi:sensor protein lytS [Spirosoma sp. KCTC 42546]|uniref:sensor histidine kinase n=1 Tax=Spirosoma sp. KCTC 42546 TaxID=2520506 RepID=UPI0011576F48|nr:histidine kinase [Spirosoma sp. KCTC 42546]QDK79004.1 sensor protein lytS [Spirosoma sp. KCTC 42546]